MKQLTIPKSITQRDHRSLTKYFYEVDKIDLISAQEEVTLARRIREGDHAALERLTKTNLRFVISVAKQYQNQGLTLSDLISEGNLGLIIAAKRYDETRGFRFISYAVWWIRQSIITAISEHVRIVRLPYNQLTLMSKLYKTQTRLEQEFGRRPSDEEVAASVELPLEKVQEMLNKSGSDISIDEPLQNGDYYTLLDILPSKEPCTDSNIEQEAITKEIYHSLKVLSKRDRDLLAMYFGLGSYSSMSLEQIGEQFDLSKEHIGRLKDKALEKLRNCSNASVLMLCLNHFAA